eukprot:scaffold681_cov173-Ochromonas_danica.AAC.34
MFNIPQTDSAAFGAAAFAVTVTLSYLLNHTDLLFHRHPVVKGLYVYPIKSCKGIKVGSVEVTKRGFKFDRWFMIVDHKNSFITQRKYRKMALITPVLLEKEGVMVITAPEMPELRIPLAYPFTASEIDVKVWDDICRAVVIEEAGSWFADYLNVPGLRLVRMANDCIRPTEPDYAPNGQAAFSDGYPYLVASEAGLDSLNSRLEIPIPMDRFRPNIVFGNTKAFAEDGWKKISIESGDGNRLVLSIVKPCARCPIPNIDQQTTISDPAPTIAMKTFRTGAELGYDNPKWKREVFFGQNAVADDQLPSVSPTKVVVGANVAILE